MTPESAANGLKAVSQLFKCSYEEAWEKYTHLAITDNFTFEEVMKHIEKEASQ